jgi:hypothetical protein
MANDAFVNTDLVNPELSVSCTILKRMHRHKRMHRLLSTTCTSECTGSSAFAIVDVGIQRVGDGLAKVGDDILGGVQEVLL